MIEVRQTDRFGDWLRGLGDRRARSRIAARLLRMEHGNLGDRKSVGDGVEEARVDVGPGYRLYYTRRGATIIILLCGGDKRTQRRDIARAKAMASEV